MEDIKELNKINKINNTNLRNPRLQIQDYIASLKKISYEECLWIFRKDPLRRTVEDNQLLINSNIALVYKIAQGFYDNQKNYNSIDISFEELFQAGVMGLTDSIAKFNSKRGTKFSTYSYHWISANIRQEIRKNVYQLKTYTYAPITVESMDNEDSKERCSKLNPMDSIYYKDLLTEIASLLKDKEVRIFKGYFLEDLSVRVIAQNEGLTTTKISYHIRKIKSLLKKKLSLNLIEFN